MSLDPDRDALAARDLLIAAAREAGEGALAWFRPGRKTSAAVQAKEGGSPVTEADLAADAFLKRRLGAAFPDAGWLSEETADTTARLGRRRLIVVDPIDGTRAFVDGDPRWTVSLALIVDGRPIAGVVHAPALAETYSAARGMGARLNGEALALAARGERAGYRVAGPKPFLAAMAATLGARLDIAPFVPSLAYRMCMAASGALDFAVSRENSHDWDIAAADLVLEEAGGRLVEASGERLQYNRERIRRDALLGVADDLAPLLLEAFGLAAAA
ncbi:myo-inositol-1(or 4)-monophosphatase [Roseiarcus fermentans]|uniref:Myo-inositol-1(Or 4)-monophosphatase n=1 Tax=Roseiarcus fermentans TaxID=1473586 RepID=A0A366EYF3_9HYPH|nr:3'(2'),5'-bisphosphate nucleotidase CysQ [Roseiarcus fermentans]RBP07384.1 myo-inositol-1(or 4)-monophosphatase [Roseiarcus fermentans]